LIAGDSPDSNSDVANEELYDPSTGTFISTGQMTTVGTHRATLLTNGKVLFVGSHTFTPGGCPAKQAKNRVIHSAL
jgi:hypothetical protein